MISSSSLNFFILIFQFNHLQNIILDNNCFSANSFRNKRKAIISKIFGKNQYYDLLKN